VINPYDEFALEEASSGRNVGGKVTLVSLGPERVRESISRAWHGRDEVYHLAENAFQGATPTPRPKRWRRPSPAGEVDAIFCGRQRSTTTTPP